MNINKTFKDFVKTLNIFGNYSMYIIETKYIFNNITAGMKLFVTQTLYSGIGMAK